MAIPHNLTVEQAGRLLRMARCGGHKCAESGPTRGVYQQLVALGVAAVVKLIHSTTYILHADRQVVEQLRQWQATLAGADAQALADVFGLLDEEANNANLMRNGHPDKQTWQYVPRPGGWGLAWNNAPEPELEWHYFDEGPRTARCAPELECYYPHRWGQELYKVIPTGRAGSVAADGPRCSVCLAKAAEKAPRPAPAPPVAPASLVVAAPPAAKPGQQLALF